jgi:hypothetical protein
LSKTLRLAALSLAALAPLACHHKAADPLQPGMDALNGAGLKVEPFHPVDARHFAALACSQGRVEGFDALVCDYGTAEGWVRGKKPAEDFIGQAFTGTWATRDRLLLVVADRDHHDPTGRSLQKVLRAFAPPR